MITFWIAAVLATAVALGLIAAFAARPVAVALDPSRAVYRRQLSEIDDMAARGLLGEEERKSAYAEAARRLLGEDDPTLETPAPPGARTFVGGVALLTGVFAVAIYLLVGHPGMPDQPFAKRLAAWKAMPAQSLDIPQVVALLEDRKDQDARAGKAPDPGLLAFLADMQMRAGNVIAAERNLERSAQLAPNEAETWDHLGQAQVELAQGAVTPDARRSLEKALTLDPKAIGPRFLLADDDIKKGRVQQGLAALKALFPDLSPDQRDQVSAEIASVEKGESVVPNSNAPPNVLAMVHGLAERLKTNPDDPDGWARLIRAYAVLGDQAKLNEALADARRYFKDQPQALATINAAPTTVAPPPQ